MVWHRYLLLCIVQGVKRKEGNFSASIQLISSIYLEDPLLPPGRRWTALAWANTMTHDTVLAVYSITLIAVLCFSGHVSLYLTKFASAFDVDSVSALGQSWERRFSLHRLHGWTWAHRWGTVFEDIQVLKDEKTVTNSSWFHTMRAPEMAI